MKKLISQDIVLAERKNQLFAFATAQSAMAGRLTMLSPTRGMEDVEEDGGALALRPRPTKRLGDSTLHPAQRILNGIEDPLGYFFQDFGTHRRLNLSPYVAFGDQELPGHVEREVECKVVRIEFTELTPLGENTECESHNCTKCPRPQKCGQRHETK